MIDSLRYWLHAHPKTSATLGGAVVALLLWNLVRQRSGPSLENSQATGAQATVWYYDLVSQALFPGPAGSFPPITTEEGHEAVRAHVFGCGGCGEAQRFVGYYEKYTLEAQQVLSERGDYRVQRDGQLLSADGRQWVYAQSPAGSAILLAARNHCPPDAPRRKCLPEGAP